MRATLFAAGVVVGVVALGAARFFALPEPVHDEPAHYHANFVLYLDGERVRLQDERYMQDIATCRVDASLVSPQDRVHLHQLIDDVVHVHAAGVTWGHFFANLGWLVGDDLVVTDSGQRHSGGDGRQLTFVLNGARVPSIANREIGSLDRLLVYHGPAGTSAEDLDRLFETVPESADAFNQSHQDGPGCTAAEHQPETTTDRLRRAFWF